MIEWQFEHFKTFTSYEMMQQAAAVLALYEGESTDGTNPKMGRLIDDLIANTGHSRWTPERENGNLNINTEGSVFRNKARLFSSFYICVPPDLLNKEGYKKQIMLTDFGKALAEGKITEAGYYEYIVKHFKYPHPTFTDYDQWIQSGNEIRPFLLILKTLVGLFEKYNAENAYITATEVYEELQPLENEDCREAVERIMKNRKAGKARTRKGDSVRKINEMLAFLSIAGYVYIDSAKGEGDKYRLNLIMRHPKEKTLFYLERSAGGAGTGTKKTRANIIEEYKKLWED